MAMLTDDRVISYCKFATILCDCDDLLYDKVSFQNINNMVTFSDRYDLNLCIIFPDSINVIIFGAQFDSDIYNFTWPKIYIV
jgi:hypothetical protein